MMPLRLQTLSSIFIMDIPDTDLDAITELVKYQMADVALPQNLSDKLLAQLARDSRLFKAAEELDDVEVEVDAPFEGAMYLVFHLMAMHAQKLYGTPSCPIALERLDHWVKRYFYYVEREVVCRAVKVPCQADAEELLAEIETELLSLEPR